MAVGSGVGDSSVTNGTGVEETLTQPWLAKAVIGIATQKNTCLRSNTTASFRIFHSREASYIIMLFFPNGSPEPFEWVYNK